MAKPINKEEIAGGLINSSQKSSRPSFKAKIVPFNRANNALKLLEQDFVNWEEEEHFQLKQVLEDLEQRLAQLGARL